MKLLVLILFLKMGSARSLDFTVTTIKHAPGLYYEYKGEAQLYASEWRLINYVNLQELNDKYAQVLRYVEITRTICVKLGHASWANETDCASLLAFTPTQLQDIEGSRSVVHQLVRKDESP